MPSYERKPDVFDFNEVPPMQAPRPSMAEIEQAGWAITPTAGLMDEIREEEFPPDPTFKPDWKTLDPRFYGISDALSKARSKEEFRQIQLKEVQQQDYEQTIAEGGPAAVASAVSQDLLDPVTAPFWLLPFGGNAGRVGQAIKFGSALGAEVGIRETVANMRTPSRDPVDSIPLTVAATALGASMGVLTKKSVQAAPKADRDRMVREQADRLRKEQEDYFKDDPGPSLSAASAVTAYGSPAKLSLEKPLTPAWVRKATITNPKYRMSHSTDHYLAEPSATIDELTRTNVSRARDDKGINPRYPAGRNNPWEDELTASQNFNAAYATRMTKNAKKVMKDSYGIKMSNSEINNLIAKVSTYGDDTTKYTDLLPIVHDFRKLNDDYMMRGVQVKMFEDDVMPRPLWNKHHGHRMYDKKKIKALPEVFVAAVVRGYKEGGDTRTVEELTERARNAVSNITSSAKIIPNDARGIRKHYGPSSTKHITLKVHDKYIEDFLIRDASAELSYMSREFMPYLTALERYGPDALEYTDKGLMIKPLRDRLKEEFADRRGQLAELDAAKAQKMADGHEQDMIDLQHIINKISGADRNLGALDRKWAIALNELRAMTSFAWLGNASLASVHEVAKAQIIHGFTNAAKSFGLVIRPTELSKANINQLRAYSMGLDTAIARSGAMLRADVEEAVALRGAGTFASRNVDKVYLLSGMDHIVRATKDTEALAFLTDMTDFAIGKQKPKKGSATYKAAKRYFTRFGLTEGDFKAVAKEVKSGGIVQERGVWLVDADKFKNGELLDKIRTAQTGGAEQSVVGTGAGEVPILLDNPVGRSLVQFKRVFFGYQNRMADLAYNLGQGDMRAMAGLTSSFALAWMAYQVRMFLRFASENPDTAAEEFSKEWSRMAIQDHVREAIERSGYTGMLFEIFSQADNAAKGGLSHTLMLNEGSKHAYRNASIMGNLAPSLSFLEKGLQFAASPLKEGGTTAQDLKSGSYLVPLRTVAYIDPFFDQLNKAITHTMPAGTKRERRYRKTEEQGVTF